MNDDELYNRWIRRADAEVPADFADRVMDAVRREPLPSSKRVLLVRLLSSPAVRVAACILACVACLFRMAAVVAVFFVQ
jgi:negative regulator of sigma E activity